MVITPKKDRVIVIFRTRHKTKEGTQGSYCARHGLQTSYS